MKEESVEAQIAVGNIVGLKSGGPAMTVVAVWEEVDGPNKTTAMANIAFFDENKLVAVDGIAIAALRKV